MATDPKPSPTQLAKDALTRLELIRKDVEALQTELEKAALPSVKERLAVLEEQVRELKRSKEEFERLAKLTVVLEDRVNKLERKEEEAGRRQWQFVYIFAGAMATLTVTVVVQLVLALVKKP